MLKLIYLVLYVSGLWGTLKVFGNAKTEKNILRTSACFIKQIKSVYFLYKTYLTKSLTFLLVFCRPFKENKDLNIIEFFLK